MLPKNLRLPKQSFLELRNRGKLFHDKHLSIVLGKNDEETRYGIIVSKKISPKAVERNRIKRMLREGIMKYNESVKRGYYILILTKKSILEADKNTVFESYENCLKKASIYMKKD